MAKGSDFERKIAKSLSLWWTDNERDDVFWRSSQSGGRATTALKSGKRLTNSAGDISYIDDIGKPFIEVFIVELKRGYGGKKRLDSKKISDIVSDIVFYSKSGKREKNEINKKTIKSLPKSGKGNDKFDYVAYMTSKIVSEVKKTFDSGKINVLDILDSNLKNQVLLDWIDKADKEAEQNDRLGSIIIFQRTGRKECVLINDKLLFTIIDGFDYSDGKEYIKFKHNKESYWIFKYDDFFRALNPQTIKDLYKRMYKVQNE